MRENWATRWSRLAGKQLFFFFFYPTQLRPFVCKWVQGLQKLCTSFTKHRLCAFSWGLKNSPLSLYVSLFCIHLAGLCKKRYSYDNDLDHELDFIIFLFFYCLVKFLEGTILTVLADKSMLWFYWESLLRTLQVHGFCMKMALESG